MNKPSNNQKKSKLRKVGRKAIDWVYNNNTILLVCVFVLAFIFIVFLIAIDKSPSVDGVVGKISNTFQISGAFIALLTWTVAWQFKHPEETDAPKIESSGEHVALIITAGNNKHPDDAIDYIINQSQNGITKERKKIFESILSSGINKADENDWEIVEPGSILQTRNDCVRKHKNNDLPNEISVNHIIPGNNNSSMIININMGDINADTEEACHDYFKVLNNGLDKVDTIISGYNNIHVFVAGSVIISALVQKHYTNVKTAHYYHWQSSKYYYVGSIEKTSFTELKNFTRDENQSEN